MIFVKQTINSFSSYLAAKLQAPVTVKRKDAHFISMPSVIAVLGVWVKIV